MNDTGLTDAVVGLVKEVLSKVVSFNVTNSTTCASAWILRFITYNDQSLAVTGWEEPSAGTLVLKIGRSTKDTYGTIHGQFSRVCKLQDDSNAKKSVLVTKEWASLVSSYRGVVCTSTDEL
jgi:hypothetical protein